MNKKIFELIKKGLEKNIDIFKLLKASSKNPVNHYNLDIGLIREKDPADFLIVKNLEKFNVQETYINGEKTDKKEYKSKYKEKKINNFKAQPVKPEQIKVKSKQENGKINVIGAKDGELYTKHLKLKPKTENGEIIPDTERDILKIVVKNRYGTEDIGIGFIKNFGLKNCAIASSVSHDSHNIVSVGTSDKKISRAMNKIIKNKGGISVTKNNKTSILKLPIAGLIAKKNHKEVSKSYKSLINEVKKSGSKLESPFMTLSFMSLPVIPELKISDKGLFNFENQSFLDLWEN